MPNHRLSPSGPFIGSPETASLASSNGSETAIAAGSGSQLLNLDGTTSALVLSEILADDELNTLDLRIRVEDATGANAWTDRIEIDLKRTAGNVRATLDGGVVAEGAVATLPPTTGLQSGYAYTIVASDTADTLTVAVAENATARVATTVCFWGEAEGAP